MLQNLIVAPPRPCTGGWHISTIDMSGQDRHQMYAQQELGEGNVLASANKRSLSMQVLQPLSPRSIARQLPSRSEMQPTCWTSLRKSMKQASTSQTPMKPSTLSSPSSRHMGRSIWRRLSELQCTGMSQLPAPRFAPACGPSSISFPWCCPD